MFRSGPNKCQIVIFDRLHEGRILGQKTIAGVDSLRTGDLAGRDDGRKRQIALCRCWGADADRLVCHAHMHGIRIGGRMDGNGFNAHFTAGTHDPEGDFASVRDKDFIEHGSGLIR